MAENSKSIPVTLQVMDSKNEDGSAITKQFDLAFAQRILNVRNQSSWKLADKNYFMVKGVITPLSGIAMGGDDTE